MISFLNGFILPALFAAAIPIILHLLSRKKARTIPFSSLKFLKVIENQRIKRVKLFQILLIIARTLFIIFLVLAFSRPTISTYAGGTSNAQTTAFIILDDSYSMQSFAYSKTYFELAKEKVGELVAGFSNDDIVFLYTQSMKQPTAITKAELQKVMAKLSVGNDEFNVKRSFSIADSIFKGHLNLNNELYIISDFKWNASEKPLTSFSEIKNFHAYKVKIGEDIPFKNISIDTVIIENQLYEIGKSFNISVRLTNYDGEETETNLNLYDGDERISMEYVNLDANESKMVNISCIPKREGTHFFKLQIDEDDLSFDNNWYFAFYLRDEIKALFVSDNISIAMQTALKILSENTIFKIKQARFNEWPGMNLDNFDLLILNDLDRIDEHVMSRLEKYMASSHAIVIIPGDALSVENYNVLFKFLVNKSLFSSLQKAGGEGFYTLENQKTANQIFDALFRDKKSTFSAPKVYKYFKQSSYGKSLIRLSNNDPFVTQTGSLMIYSSSFSSGWTDIEINGLFLPLLYRSFYHISQTKNPVSDMQSIGKNITFFLDGAAIDKNYYIQNPSGKKYSVIPKPVRNRLLFNGGKSIGDGFYTLLDENKPLVTEAINHSAKELKKPFITEEAMDFPLTYLTDKNFMQQIQSARLGFELWMICLILAFIMLIAEMVLIKVIEGTPFLRKV